MAQILVFGDSISNGVGGVNGSWVDMLKKDLHSKMYEETSTGRIHEVYNFANPGKPVQFVLDTYKEQLKYYKKEGEKTISFVLVGANDVRAIGTPDNYFTSNEDYKVRMINLLTNLKQESDEVYMLPLTPCDETKTTPKKNNLGSYSYFFNSRVEEFNAILESISQELDIKMLKYSFNEDYWIKNCLFRDGLHPNNIGYQLMYKDIISQIKL